MKAYIRSVGAYTPEKVCSNQDLSHFLDTSDDWIFTHTGIKNRHIADKSQAASDLGVEAAKIALSRSGLKPEDIDMVLTATSTPDYHGFPSTACIIQARLGIPAAGAFDMQAACSGFIYAVEVARNFIQSGSCRNVLVVASEIMTSVLNWDDRNTAVLFGDGAGAVVLSSAPDDEKRGIFHSILRSDGSGAETLKVQGGGSRNPYKPEGMPKEELYLFMDGRSVYNFAVKALVELTETMCEQAGIDRDQIKYIVPHQANSRIIQNAAKRLKMPLDKFYMNLEEFANTSGATIPIAINEMYEKGLLNSGDLLLLIGFGGGLTYGGNFLYW